VSGTELGDLDRLQSQRVFAARKTDDPAPMASTQRVFWLVLTVAAVTHAPGLFGGFVLDDNHAILNHGAVNGSLPLWELWTREWFGRPLHEGWSSSYRPITTMTFAIEMRLFEGAALPHLSNWILYVGLCGVLMRALLVHVSTHAALVAGMLFAVWPVHVEDVASLVGRAELLASLFALLALVRMEQDVLRLREVALTSVLYALALLSKETIALLPAIVGWRVLLRWRRGTVTREHWMGLGLLCVVGGAYIVPRQIFLSVELPAEFVGADNPLLAYAGAERVWGTIAIVGHYADVGVRALRLCADHTWGDVIPARTLTGEGAIFVWVGILLIVGALVDTYRAWQGKSQGWWGAAALAYILIGHWLIPLSVVLAERLLLWPSILLAFALAHALDHRSEILRGPARIGLALLALWWAARTVERSMDWHDPISLGKSSVASCPRALHARLALAAELVEIGRHEEALWHFGVLAASRRSFPVWTELPAYAVELELPLAQRLSRLPEFTGAGSPSAFWAGLANYLASQGWHETASHAMSYARGRRP